MTRSVLLKVAATLGVASGICLPVSAQVSTGLLNQTFGGTGVVNSAFSALKTGGLTTTNTAGSEGASTGGTQGSSTTGASGGRTGTFTFSGAEGDSQRFAVGTGTSIGVNSSASSTAEYAVTSKSSLGLGASSTSATGDLGASGSSGASSFRQTLGSTTLNDMRSWSPTTTSATDGQISGSFKSTENTTATAAGDKNATNDVTVKGIGNTADIKADPTKSVFSSDVTKTNTSSTASNSATANGSAGGSVNSTASADAARTSFSSIFLQSF